MLRGAQPLDTNSELRSFRPYFGGGGGEDMGYAWVTGKA